MNISSSYVTSHENYGSGGCNYGTFYGSFPLSIRETFEQWHFPYDGVFFKKVWVTSFFLSFYGQFGGKGMHKPSMISLIHFHNLKTLFF